MGPWTWPKGNSYSFGSDPKLIMELVYLAFLEGK